MEARDLLETSLEELCAHARALRDEGHGTLVTYSPKVFVPLTTLCRDVCHYCTFARPPRRGERAYLTLDEVLAIARAGAAAGCHEALFTLGDKPELRYRVAREELAALGCAHDARVPGARGAGGAGRDRAAAAPEPRRADRGRPARARDRSARRWGSCSRPPRSGSRARAARTSARPTSCRPRGWRRSRPPASWRPVHDGDPDRHRRDARRAARRAARDPRARRAPRPHAGGDRPELPRQAGHEDGRPPRAVAGRAPLDDRRRARRARPGAGPSRRRRTWPTTTSRACSTRASTTGAASRR